VEPTAVDPSAPWAPDPDAPAFATTAMVWSHHWPHDYDRCVRVGAHHVCRRCIVLYPVALVVMAVTLATGWPRSLDPWLMIAAPLPMTAEWVLEHLAVVRHSPRRLAVTTFLGALALGRGFARYMDDRADPLAWGMAFFVGVICAASAYVGARRAAHAVSA
jgi:hypothetical protein